MSETPSRARPKQDARPEARARLPRALKIARGLVIALAGAWAVLIAVVFALRVGFPLELEWMEGGTLQQAWRVQQGLPVYGPPTPEFVPFLYTPLYPALVALLGFVFPLDFALARALSILATFATCAGLWRLCAIEAKPHAHRAMAVGLFLSGYVFSFRWLDLARGDALFLALVLWGLILLRESEGNWRRAVLAGVLVAAAFWTKQTAAVFVLASGLVGLLVAPREVWIYAGTIAVLAGGGVLVGQALTEGWLWTWIYEMHQTHAFNEERFRSKTWGMFVHAAPFLAAQASMLLGVGLGLALRRARQLRRVLAARRDTARAGEASELPGTWSRAIWLGLREARGQIYWAVFAGAGLLVSALGYSTQFAEPNAFIPGVCFGAACLAVALPDAARMRESEAGLVGVRRVVEGVGLGLAAAQLCFAFAVEPMYQPIQSKGLEAGLGQSYAWQDPSRTLPSAAQRRAAHELRESIEAREGARLLALHRPWWPIMAGGAGHVGAMGITDVGEAQRGELQAELRARIEAGEIDAVWIEGSVPRWLSPKLRRWSVLERRWGARRVRPMSGWMSVAGMVTPWRGEQLLLGPPVPAFVPAGAEVLADFESGTLDGFEVTGGIAFGRRPVHSFSRGMAPIGPHGGLYVVSSAASGRREQARGELRSPAFTLARGGVLELALGTNGRRKDLAVEVLGDEDQVFPLEIPQTRMDLQRVRWSVPDELAGHTLRLRLIDDSDKAALFVDDIWLWNQAPASPPQSRE